MIGSANNKPYDRGDARIGWFFPADDRIRRMYAMMEAKEKLSVEDMQAIQVDVFSIRHKALHQKIIAESEGLHLKGDAKATLDAIRGWDGNFAADSREAYLYHLAYLYLADSLYEAVPTLGGRRIFRTSGFLPTLIKDELDKLSPEKRRSVLITALSRVHEVLDDEKVWGDIHRLKVQHLLGNIPLLGRRYRMDDIPVAGHDSTLMKTSGNLTDEEHTARYGSQSRHISDLSDINANYFVLFGGQDGALNSESALDQVPLWQRGEYVHVPFELEKVKALFMHKSTFMAHQ